jgi:hypothetical protein
MNPTAITALVDWWRPDMHNFYLQTGEMTVMLEDMAMILVLPIEGSPLCIDTSCDDWSGKMVDLIGKCPGDTINKDGVKLRVTAGLPSNGSQFFHCKSLFPGHKAPPHEPCPGLRRPLLTAT